MYTYYHINFCLKYYSYIDTRPGDVSNVNVRIAHISYVEHKKIDTLKSNYDIIKARIPEWSKGTDLRSVAFASWVRIPLRALVSIAQLVRASVL